MVAPQAVGREQTAAHGVPEVQEPLLEQAKKKAKTRMSRVAESAVYRWGSIAGKDHVRIGGADYGTFIDQM